MARGRAQRAGGAGDKASGIDDAGRDRQIVESLNGGGIDAALSSLSKSIGFQVPAPSPEGAERALELARALEGLHQGAWPERLPFVKRGLDVRASDLDDLCAGWLCGDPGERALGRIEGPLRPRSTDPEPDLALWISRCRDIVRAPAAYPTLPQWRKSQDAHRRLFVPLSPRSYLEEFLGRFGSVAGAEHPCLAIGLVDSERRNRPRSLHLAHEIASRVGGETWEIICLVPLGETSSARPSEAVVRRRLRQIGAPVERLYDPTRTVLWNGSSHMPSEPGELAQAPARFGPERCRHASGRWDAYGHLPSGFRLSCHDCLRRAIAFMPLHRAPASMLAGAGANVRRAIAHPHYVAHQRFYRRLSRDPAPAGDSFEELRSTEWIMDPRPSQYAITPPATTSAGLPIEQALETRRRAERVQ